MNKITSMAPARVCLFGDHQDYLELPIIACAINRYIKLIGKTNNSELFIVSKPDINETQIINIYQVYDSVEKGDYLGSALKVLRKYECIPTAGYDIEISGNIAINAGTSSSSALIISWIRFLLQAFGCNQKITKELVAKIAYEAEVLEHVSSGGRMDQFSIGLGNIIYLETDANSNFKTIGTQLNGLIVAESGVPKPTNAVLKELKEKAQKSIAIIQEKFPDFHLKTAQEKDIDSYLKHLPAHLHPYFEAAIQNHSITQKAVIEFNKSEVNHQIIGELMSAHHLILKEKLNLTIPVIDAMINSAITSGAYGAKIVGSGRGGCIVALAPKNKEQEIIQNLINAGAVNAYSVSVDTGARIVN